MKEKLKEKFILTEFENQFARAAGAIYVTRDKRPGYSQDVFMWDVAPEFYAREGMFGGPDSNICGVVRACAFPSLNPGDYSYVKESEW